MRVVVFVVYIHLQYLVDCCQSVCVLGGGNNALSISLILLGAEVLPVEFVVFLLQCFGTRVGYNLGASAVTITTA